MPINRKLMNSLRAQYGAKKGEDVYYAMENKRKSEKTETADALTEVLDSGKQSSSSPPIKVFATSYWEQWLAKQKARMESPEKDDLLLLYLLNMGNRPDLGAGLRESAGKISIADTAAVSSASGSGAATTVSNLWEIIKRREK